MPSLYICVFVVIGILSVVTLTKPQTDKYLYYISFCILTLFLCIRFGQGTDYPGYMCIYHVAETALDPELGFSYYLSIVHSEIGWKALMVLCKLFNADFWVVTLVVAVVTMLCTHLCINRFCTQYKTLALVLLYPTIYLTYYFSGIRQGLAMAVFYGILLSRVLDKKYVTFILGVLAISTIHKASVCYLIVPIVLVLDKKVIQAGAAISVMLAIGMILEPVRELLCSVAVMGGVSVNYFGEPSVSWFSLAERFLMATLVFVLWKQSEANEEIKMKVTPLLKIYITGLLVYICLCSNSFISSRIAIMFKMVEIILIPLLLEGVKDRMRDVVFMILLGISSVMMYKNLNYYSEIYYEGICGWNLPYVTIFHQTDILNYRNEFVNYAYDFEEHNYISDWF